MSVRPNPTCHIHNGKMRKKIKNQNHRPVPVLTIFGNKYEYSEFTEATRPLLLRWSHALCWNMSKDEQKLSNGSAAEPPSSQTEQGETFWWISLQSTVGSFLRNRFFCFCLDTHWSLVSSFLFPKMCRLMCGAGRWDLLSADVKTLDNKRVDRVFIHPPAVLLHLTG